MPGQRIAIPPVLMQFLQNCQAAHDSLERLETLDPGAVQPDSPHCTRDIIDHVTQELPSDFEANTSSRLVICLL